MNTDEAYQLLAHAWRNGRLAQGYIAVGSPRGEGREFAEKVLTLVFCTAQEAPCNRCAACRQVENHSHADALWVEPQKTSRRISIEQIREVQSRIYQTSLAGGWKACVIVSADRLGPQASNAFLKTLEEPPPRCVFLLLTDGPQFLLSTIVSRCQTVLLSAAESVLEGAAREDLVKVLSADLGGGEVATLARAELIDGMLKAFKKEAAGEVGAQEDADDEEDVTLKARINALYREKRTCLLRSLLLWQRDILLLASGGDAKLVFFSDQLETLRQMAGGVSAAEALQRVRYVEDMNRQLERNLSDGAVLAHGFARLR